MASPCLCGAGSFAPSPCSACWSPGISFPQHARAPQAQLGIGETYEKTSEAERALEAYGLVPELFPDSPEAPTALLRAGRIEAERNNRDEARTLFNQLVAAYPDSPEAETAREELADLRR